MEIDRDSTEYIFVGVTGEVPSAGGELAFKLASIRPESGDWETTTIVDDAGDALWADAQASGVNGDYWLARLIGPFGGNDVVLTQGDYQVWVRLTDVTERPIRIAPVVLEVL